MEPDTGNAAAIVFAAIGECMIELSPRGDDLWRMGVAGDTGNVAFYARRLLPRGDAGGDVAHVSALGDDPFSDRIAATLAGWGIRTDHLERIAGRNAGLYAITLDGAERSFTYWRGQSAARHLADDADRLARALDGIATLYLSGITLAILAPDARATLLRLLAERRRDGVRIAFDPNYRPALWGSVAAARDAIGDACRTADIVLPTFADEQALFGDRRIAETADRLAGLGVAEFAIKDGDRPCLLGSGGVVTEVPALRPDRLVDTTGAGDSFNAGYLAARILGHEPLRAARLGHAVAAQVVGAYGAIVELDRRRAFQDADLG